jgi:NADPH:quinone reductase-like Zn-dependent oxidoreductase
MPEGWVRVRVTHASLNRHDIFTLLGVTAQKEPIPFPMILEMMGPDCWTMVRRWSSTP